MSILQMGKKGQVKVTIRAGILGELGVGRGVEGSGTFIATAKAQPVPSG